MGAFLLCPDRFTVNQGLEIFKKKGFKNPKVIHLKQWKIYLYQKQLLDELNYLESNDGLIFSVGTVFYKGRDYSTSLKLIWNEFSAGSIDPELLTGSFFIFIHHCGKDFYLTDRAAIQNVFYNRETKIVSSSFLAMLAVLGEIHGKQPLNPLAICEVLTTGNLIGPDTLIKSIVRYEPALHSEIPGLHAYSWPKSKVVLSPEPSNSCDPASQQLTCLTSFFERSAAVMNKYGVLSGLTGGLDSRLLYLLLRRHVENRQLYTTYREKQGNEFRVVAEFAAAANESIISPIHTSPEKTDPEKLLCSIRENFYFNDGLIRTHQIWIEEIKSREYLKRLYGPFRIGLSGVGGEQYRNSRFLLRKHYKIRSWIWNELVFRNSGDAFISSQMRETLIGYLQEKIEALLGMKDQDGYITRFQIMRYYNEIWNPANRTTRNNIENQLAFFISPFTDFGISEQAYSLIPHLNSGFDLENEMICSLDPELAHIRTNYGFAPKSRVPTLYRVLPYIKSLFGLSVFTQFDCLRKRKFKLPHSALFGMPPSIEIFLEWMKTWSTPIKFDNLQNNAIMAPLLIELGVFMSEMEKYIDHD